jgi:hypothetical protein
MTSTWGMVVYKWVKLKKIQSFFLLNFFFHKENFAKNGLVGIFFKLFNFFTLTFDSLMHLNYLFLDYFIFCFYFFFFYRQCGVTILN